MNRRFVYDRKLKKVVETTEVAVERAAPGTQWRNHLSQSVSIHPRQVRKYRKFVKDFAIPGVTVNNEGRVGFATQNSQDKYLKALSRDKPPGEQYVNVDR